MRRTATALIALAGISLLAAACGSDDEQGSAVRVTATTGILADITEHVVGPDAQVQQLIPDSASPHDFALSAQDRAELEDSALLVHNGAGLEAGVPIDEIDVEGWALADHAGELLALGDDEHAGEQHEQAEDDHGGEDPHVWMDPTRVAAALPSLADVLAEADPAHASGYRERAAAYARELGRVDRGVRRALEPVPPQDRKLVTSHDALGYFADRYGFEVIATAFPASGPEAESSAQAIAEVEAAIESSGVPAVFAEETDDPEALEQIADRTGVEIVTGMLVESPGSAGSYTEMLGRDAALIFGALSGL